MAAKSSTSPSQSTSAYTNHRYLTTPEKVDRLRNFHKKNRSLIQRRVQDLEKKAREVLKTDGICIDDELSKDLKEVMNDGTATISSDFPDNSFRSIFWKHQLESLNKEGKKKNGNRWHPLMIRWCLYLAIFFS